VVRSCFRQLKIVKEKGLAFAGFTEPPIDFLPTYKYDNGTNIYDTRCDAFLRRLCHGCRLPLPYARPRR